VETDRRGRGDPADSRAGHPADDAAIELSDRGGGISQDHLETVMVHLRARARGCTSALDVLTEALSLSLSLSLCLSAPSAGATRG
jgi:hypothetical protein